MMLSWAAVVLGSAILFLLLPISTSSVSNNVNISRHASPPDYHRNTTGKADTDRRGLTTNANSTGTRKRGFYSAEASDAWKAWVLQDEFAMPKHVCKETKKLCLDWTVCMDNILPALATNSCLVYSVGIADDTSFDRAISAMGCQVFMFDPTVDYQRDFAPNIKFFKYGLYGGGNTNSSTAANFQSRLYGKIDGSMYTLKELIRLMGHEDRSITVLKIDCEGCEWEVFGGNSADSVSASDFATIEQLLVEFHFSQLYQVTHTSKFKQIGQTMNNLFSYHVTGPSASSSRSANTGGAAFNYLTTDPTVASLRQFYFNYNGKGQYAGKLLPELLTAGLPTWSCCRNVGFIRVCESSATTHYVLADHHHHSVHTGTDIATATGSKDAHIVLTGDGFWNYNDAFKDFCLRDVHCVPKASCKETIKIGMPTAADSSWDVCMDSVRPALATNSCLILSVGLSQGLAFETAMGKLGCHVLAFAAGDDRLNTTNVGIAERSNVHMIHSIGGDTGMMHLNLHHLFKTAEKRFPSSSKWDITILKLDCFGCEWSVLGLAENFKGAPFTKIHQIVANMHFNISDILPTSITLDAWQQHSTISEERLSSLIGRTYDNLFSLTSSTSAAFKRLSYEYTGVGAYRPNDGYNAVNKLGYPIWGCCRHAVYLRQT